MNTISIHFLHGSVPKWKYRKEAYKIRGGLLGGHIYIQVNKDIFGFEPFDNKHFHIIPKCDPAAFNSRCKHELYDDWAKSMIEKEITSVLIPLNDESITIIKNYLERNARKPSFDYALLGMRCGSFTHYCLSKIHVVKRTTPLLSMLKIPYPRKLRNILTQKATMMNWKVKKSIGTDKRIWEGR
jgi:hypothetical protein